MRIGVKLLTLRHSLICRRRRSRELIVVVLTGALICVALASCTGLGPSSTPDAGSRPDLVVASPGVSADGPEAGATFTLSVRVRNQGDESSAATTLRYYRSTDATISTSDTEVGMAAVAALAASASSSESADVTAPAVAGTYYYGACVDAVTGESDTTNNCSESVQVTVPAPGRHPDLAVTSPSVSDGGPAPGATITLSATVRNGGDGAAEATVLRYYRSTDATISTSDTEVGMAAVAALAASASSDHSVELTAPETPGTYYYGGCVDAVAEESDTTNNCSESVQVTVPAPGPDLVVASPSLNDSGPTAGAVFTVSATVRNDGEGPSTATTLRYYRSTDATITTSDTEVGTVEVAALAASASSSESAEVTAPAVAGTYYYGACVEAVTGESDATNNCSPSAEVTVSEPESVVTTPTVSDSAPAAGATFTLSVRVESAGNGVAATATLSIYRSTDATITRSDTLVGTVVADLVTAENGSQSARISSSKTPGTSYAGEVELTAPDTPGTYYFGACMDAVKDGEDSTDNCSPAARVDVGAPDLVVTSPSVSDSGPAAGATFTLTATVRNDGNGASAATTLRYYQSTDTSITTTDTDVGTDSIAELAAGGISDQTIDLTAPDTAGTYYYGACVGAVTDEADITNNCSASVQVTVPGPKPDLAMRGWSTSVLLPEPGATFTLMGTVWNLGDKASAATTLRWYRSTDATLTTSDTSEGTDAVTELAPSGNVDKRVELTAPTSVGTYYYGACVDAVTGESDTTNNCSSTQITVRDAHLVGIYSLSNAVTEGMSVRFRVTATPQPTVALAVNLKSIEYAVGEDGITYYNWPPAEATLTIGAGSSSTTLTVGTIDDSDEDGNSTLSAWIESGSGYTRDPGRSGAVVAVVDDDGSAGDSVLSITPVSTPVTEGTAVQFTVGANPAPTAAVTIGYRVWETGSILSESLDPGWNSGTVTIGAEQTSATLSFGTVNDSTDEEDGEVTVTLIVDTYPDGVELGRPAEASVTVLDDD